MERFKVSGQELRNFYKQETLLGHVFRDIELELKQKNHVVCQFIVNGLELSENEESKFSHISLSEVHTLEYLCDNSDNLFKSVVKSWLEALPELIQNTEFLADRIKTAGFTGSYKAICDLVENCQYLMGSMVSLKSMLGDVNIPFNQKWLESEKFSHTAVKNAIEAIEKKDFVQLSEILEYDLNHALQSWNECLKEIGVGIEGQHRKANSLQEHRPNPDRRKSTGH